MHNLLLCAFVCASNSSLYLGNVPIPQNQLYLHVLDQIQNPLSPLENMPVMQMYGEDWIN